MKTNKTKRQSLSNPGKIIKAIRSISLLQLEEISKVRSTYCYHDSNNIAKVRSAFSAFSNYDSNVNSKEVRTIAAAISCYDSNVNFKEKTEDIRKAGSMFTYHSKNTSKVRNAAAAISCYDSNTDIAMVKSAFTALSQFDSNVASKKKAIAKVKSTLSYSDSNVTKEIASLCCM